MLGGIAAMTWSTLCKAPILALVVAAEHPAMILRQVVCLHLLRR